MSTAEIASWLPVPTSPVDGMYLYRTGEALLKRSEGDIGGVPLKRIAAIVQVGEKTYDEQQSGLFTPFVQLADGSRSFLPIDLDDAEEQPLHDLADRCADPIVRARLYEVLLARFPARRGVYQLPVIAARLASLALLDGWPDLLNKYLALKAKRAFPEAMKQG